MNGQGIVSSPREWSEEQWGDVELGDARLERRAVQIGEAMVKHPDASLPEQMKEPAALKGAYRLINDERIGMEQLSAPHWNNTRKAAEKAGVVLFPQDTSVLNYTHHPTKQGLGPVGDGLGRGVLLHTVLAVVPGEVPDVLGVTHQQVVLRKPTPDPRPIDYVSDEGRVWSRAVDVIGQAPADVCWVHVGDRGSDDFRFMHRTREAGAHFLIRVKHNRLLHWEEKVDEEMRKMKDYARSLPSEFEYQLDLPALHKRKARQAQMRLAWTPITIPAPARGPHDLRHQSSISAWLIRAWEVDAPTDVEEPLEWILITSVPVENDEDALERTVWYSHRWLMEEYFTCLKTGCSIEKRQFDHTDDIRRLLGFCAPIAVQILQMRQIARLDPDRPAATVIDPLTIEILLERLPRSPAQPLTMRDFVRGVAQLGGYQGRRGDGPPGWKTIWRGWRYLSDLVAGARLAHSLMLRERFLDALQGSEKVHQDEST